jgi:ATP-dependent DNA helicase RecG
VDVEYLESLIWLIRHFNSETPTIEAKKASDQLPTSAIETLSAFANTPSGGVLLLGVDESSGFEVTGVSNPSKIQADLASTARDRLYPPMQPTIELVTVDGKTVVCTEVQELPRAEKPCFVKSRGINRGSYIRVGDGDRRLTTEEVQQLIADRGQPRFDHEVVDEADIEDLDQKGLQNLLDRLRTNNPRIFGHEDDEAALRMVRVIHSDKSGKLRPTLAGLLALGRYPQQFFPQLCLTFVHYPTKGRESAEPSTRFLDNVRIDGSIPAIAKDALLVIQRNMTRRALISGGGRQDVWEYPPEALREAVVNALVHRDLSPGSRGTQVQVEMFPDRLRILNPGGLFGAVDITRLGEEGISSSRNSLLLKILEDVAIPGETRTVCENRGSGIRTMRRELAKANMSPPWFDDRATAFEVVLPNHTLLDEDTLRWLAAFGSELRDTQRTALALMRRNEVLDNAKYRAATGISDSRIATAELQDLVARELVEQRGTRGGARYTLSEYARSLDESESDGRRRVRPNRRRQVVDLLRVHGDLSKVEVSTRLNINTKTAEHWLRILRREGLIEFTEPGRGTKNTRYKLTARSTQESLFEADS